MKTKQLGVKSLIQDNTFKNYVRGKLVSLCLRGQGLAKFEHRLLQAFDDLVNDNEVDDVYLDRLDSYIRNLMKDYK